jgi:hypothetical protein
MTSAIFGLPTDIRLIDDGNFSKVDFPNVTSILDATAMLLAAAMLNGETFGAFFGGFSASGGLPGHIGLGSFVNEFSARADDVNPIAMANSATTSNNKA